MYRHEAYKRFYRPLKEKKAKELQPEKKVIEFKFISFFIGEGQQQMGAPLASMGETSEWDLFFYYFRFLYVKKNILLLFIFSLKAWSTYYIKPTYFRNSVSKLPELTT